MIALRSSRALIALLLACLLAGRMLVPTGWMPVRTAQGITVTLCSGNGLAGAEAWIDAAAKLHHGPKPAGHAEPKDPCPFGAISAPAALPSAPALPALAPALAALVPALPLAVAIGQGLAAPPPPATGPPLSA